MLAPAGRRAKGGTAAPSWRTPLPQPPAVPPQLLHPPARDLTGRAYRGLRCRGRARPGLPRRGVAGHRSEHAPARSSAGGPAAELGPRAEEAEAGGEGRAGRGGGRDDAVAVDAGGEQDGSGGGGAGGGRGEQGKRRRLQGEEKEGGRERTGVSGVVGFVVWTGEGCFRKMSCGRFSVKTTRVHDFSLLHVEINFTDPIWKIILHLYF